MGYEITIEECNLNGSLEDLDIDEIWVEDKETHDISVKERHFKWQDWFEDDLKTMSAAGVKGDIHISGEEGEHSKYHLDGAGTVSEFEGTITFSEIPNRVLLAAMATHWQLTRKDEKVISWKYESPYQSENVPRQYTTVTVTKMTSTLYGLNIIQTTGTSDVPIVQTSYPTEEEAMKAAIEYMEEHGG